MSIIGSGDVAHYDFAIQRLHFLPTTDFGEEFGLFLTVLTLFKDRALERILK